MSVARKFGLAVAGILLLLLGVVYWAVGTSSGTRFILARAASALPESLAIGEAQGSLLHGVRLESLTWSDDSTRVAIRDLFVDIAFFPLFSRHIAINTLDIDRAEVRLAAASEAEATGSLPTVSLPVDLSIAAATIRSVTYRDAQQERAADLIGLSGSLKGSKLRVNSLTLRSAWLNVDLDARLQLDDRYPGRARIRWQWKDSPPNRYSGTLQLEGDLARYQVRHVLDAPIAVLTSGAVSFMDGELRADLTNKWTALNWPLGERHLHSSSGSLRLRGSLSRFDVELDANATLDNLPETHLRLAGSADQEHIELSLLDARNDVGRLEATGNVRWLPDPGLDLEYALSDLDPAALYPGMSGAVAANGSVSARMQGDAPAVDLLIARLAGDINGYLPQGRATVSYAGDTLTVTDGEIRLGANTASINGSIGAAVTLEADVDAAALDEIIPAASGSLRGRLGLSGNAATPRVQLDLAGRKLAWRDQFLDEANLVATGQLAQHTIRTTLRRDGIQLELAATGGYAQDRWSGVLQTLNIDNDVMGTWSAREPSELSYSSDQIALAQICIYAAAQAGRACFGGKRTGDGAAAFNVIVEDLPLAALPFAPPPDVNVSGSVNAELRGDLTDRGLTGNARIEWRDPAIDTTYEGESIAVTFSEALASATITQNQVDATMRLAIAGDAGAANLQLVVQDYSNGQAPVNGRADIAVSDVSLFAVLVPGILNPRGQITGELAISGEFYKPDLAGEIALTSGSFRIRQANIELTEIGVRLAQRQDGRLELTGTAKSGDGQVSISGSSQIGASGLRTDVAITGENFELIRLPDWQATASPAINIVMAERGTVVKGELEIPTANIKVKEIPTTAASPSPDVVVHRPEGEVTSSGRRIDIDVKTVLGDDVQLSGFGLTTGLSGAVQLRGGTNAPYTGIGRLALRDGRYKAYGQVLEIERGELIFNGPLDSPQLDIRAVRRAADVTAGIQLTGTPSNLRSTVFSDPVLSDAEALSYLLTGRPLASATSAGEGDTLNNAAFALGLSGAGSIASRIRGDLGLETLTVEGGADSGRILAGKRIGDRLLVEYGYGLIDKLGTLLLRYQLNDRLVLESRTGTVSNLDVVYSVKKD